MAVRRKGQSQSNLTVTKTSLSTNGENTIILNPAVMSINFNIPLSIIMPALHVQITFFTGEI